MTSLNLQTGALAVGFLCLASVAISQEPLRRQFNGWSAVSATPQSAVVHVQQAMYQAPGVGGNSGETTSLPSLPAGNYGRSFTPAQSDFANVQVFPPNQQVLPPNMPVAPQSQFSNGGSSPLAITDLSSASQLRQTSIPGQANVQPSTAASTQIRPIQQGYVTGPPFVSPPAPRVGTFPTSPYQYGQYQQISYPGTTNVRPAQYQTQVAQQAAVLPQNQPVVGIYPTSYQNCAPGIAGPTFPATGAVPGNFAPPTLPPNLTPGLYSPDNGGYTPLLSLGQENYNVLLGRGIVGQPTVYVPGQPIRNFLRYLSP